MYEDALMACFFDNPGVCTAFLTWGFTDKYSWMNDRAGGDVYPLLYTDDYSEKPSYDALLTSLQNPPDSIFPEEPVTFYNASELSFRHKAQDPNLDECADCEGECRFSWPLNDPDTYQSEEAAYRC